MRISDWSSDVCSSDLLDGCGNRQSSAIFRGAMVNHHSDKLRNDSATSGSRRGKSGGQVPGPFLTMITRRPPFPPSPRRGPDYLGFALAVAIGVVALAVLRSEEHTSELQSLMRISYAVFCLKKKTNKK